MLELVLVLEAVLELVLVLVGLASTQVASWHLDVSLMYLGFFNLVNLVQRSEFVLTCSYISSGANTKLHTVSA